MDDLIPRAAAIEAATKWYVKPDGEIFNAIKTSIKSQIEQVTVVDAVPVVRCANCERRWTSLCKMYAANQETADDWFCADGERSAEADDCD